MPISLPAWLWSGVFCAALVQAPAGGELPVRLLAFARISSQKRQGRALYQHVLMVWTERGFAAGDELTATPSHWRRCPPLVEYTQLLSRPQLDQSSALPNQYGI